MDKHFSSSPTSIHVCRVSLVLSNTLDCDILSATFASHRGFHVEVATTDIDSFLERCKSFCPQVLILDPKVASDALTRAVGLARRQQIEHLLILDDRLYESRLESILPTSNISYLTRQLSLESLQKNVLRVSQGGRVFAPEVEQRLQQSARGLELQQSSGRRAVASLTSRELQIMLLLAGGRTVRSCAEHLGLAESTIDNHKARLMKKLDIHKAIELAHLAIREGLIVV